MATTFDDHGDSCACGLVVLPEALDPEALAVVDEALVHGPIVCVRRPRGD